MWQPNYERAKQYGWPVDHVDAVLNLSGANAEIDRLTALSRLTALLAMKDETINTLRTQLHKATATTQDDYDSGYRAA